MAKKMTTRKKLAGNKRSEALNATRRYQKLNMIKIKDEFGKPIRISVREKRTLDKQAQSA